jgi:hypothetical protein
VAPRTTICPAVHRPAAGEATVSWLDRPDGVPADADAAPIAEDGGTAADTAGSEPTTDGVADVADESPAVAAGGPADVETPSPLDALGELLRSSFR